LVVEGLVSEEEAQDFVDVFNDELMWLSAETLECLFPQVLYICKKKRRRRGEPGGEGKKKRRERD
jgi:hypothetical protein